MNAIVVGCGRFGAELAERLYRNGHYVTVVDESPEAFKVLPSDFQGRLCEGDALNQDVLRRAGIETADSLATVTNSDAFNLVIGRIASEIFQVPRVVARNYDPDARALYEIFGLQVVSAASWGAQRVEEMLDHGDFVTVFSTGNGEVEIYEFIVTQDMDGKLLGEYMGVDDCVVVALNRAGRAYIPKADMVVEKSDIFYVSATANGIVQFNNIFHKPQED